MSNPNIELDKNNCGPRLPTPAEVRQMYIDKGLLPIKGGDFLDDSSGVWSPYRTNNRTCAMGAVMVGEPVGNNGDLYLDFAERCGLKSVHDTQTFALAFDSGNEYWQAVKDLADGA